MSPLCDLCPSPASRWYEPSGAARCREHELPTHATPVPATRGWTFLASELPATVRPPACACGRPEIPGYPCAGCSAGAPTVESVVAQGTAYDRALTSLPLPDRLEVWRRVAAARRAG
jgi:hypothetical protein